jgi:hypothetical protein
MDEQGSNGLRAVCGGGEVADLVHRLAFKLCAATYGHSREAWYRWSQSKTGVTWPVVNWPERDEN